MKNEQATMDARSAPLFVKAMVDFTDKAELLQRLLTSSEFGLQRLRDALTAGVGSTHFAAVTGPLLQLLVSEELNKPLCREGVLKLHRHVLDTPMLLDELQTRCSDYSSTTRATVCAFLVEAAKCSQAARRTPTIRAIAAALSDAAVPKAAHLLDLIGPGASPLPQQQQQQQRQQQRRQRSAVDVSWAFQHNLPGGRHDNDHLHYRDIALLPTPAELACGESPYLPLASKANAFLRGREGDAASQRAAAVQTVLDSRFRLLREDLVQPMREQQQQQHNHQQRQRERVTLPNARVVAAECERYVGGAAYAVVAFDSKPKWDRSFWFENTG
jgi:hypothetical protein